MNQSTAAHAQVNQATSSRAQHVDIGIDARRQAFIDEYLERRMYARNDANRIIVDCGIASHPGAANAPRDDLIAHLDQLYSICSL